jgi:hypothetical protein
MVLQAGDGPTMLRPPPFTGPANVTTTRRKSLIFGYAVERRLLPVNSRDQIQQKPSEVADTVDDHCQSRPGHRLLNAVRG